MASRHFVPHGVVFRRLSMLFGLLMLGGCGHRAAWEGMTPQQVAEVARQKSIGIAYLEVGQPKLAEAPFRRLIRMAPHLSLGYANLAVALLPDSARSVQALEYARRAVDLAPGDAAARMVLAQILLDQRDDDGAVQQLQAAVKAEPSNVRALYQLAEANQRRANGNPLAPERGRPLQQLVQRAGDNLIAQLAWAQFAAGTGKLSEARAALDRLAGMVGSLPSGGDSALKAARAALQAGNYRLAATSTQVLANYLRPMARAQGDRNALVGADSDPARLAVREFNPPPPALTEPPAQSVSSRFEDVTAAMGLPAEATGARATRAAATVAGSVAIAPLTEKSPLSLYLTSSTGSGTLYANRDGRLVDLTIAAGLAGIAGTVAQFVDVDNDLKLDLYVAGRGPDRVLRGLGGGRFVAMPLRGLTTGGEVVGALWGDFDHEGDLDLLRLERGPGGQDRARLFQNNGGGSFTEITRSAGLTASVQQPRMALFGDFDEDGDLDMLIVNEGGANRLYDNLRTGRFADAAAARGLASAAGSRTAAATDIDHDGLLDLVVLGAGNPRITLYRSREIGRFISDTSLSPLLDGFTPADVAFLDYDNDGETDMIVAGRGSASGADAGGLRLLRGAGRGRFTDASSILPAVPPARAVVPADLDGDGGIDLVVLREDGQLTLLRNLGGAKNHWLNVVLQGKIDEPSTDNWSKRKHNAFGLGATIEVKTGRQYQKQTVTQPVTHFGLGSTAAHVDVVRVVWSNGVPQNWPEPIIPRDKAGHPVGPAREPPPLDTDAYLHAKQVIVTSCPFVYAWDGEHYRFVTDFLWRGPLGLSLSRTQVAPHDQTTDYVKIPGAFLRPVNGNSYFLSLTEELWETTYLDYARLVAVDHPVGTEVWVDEVFRPGPPAPFRLYPVARERLPVSAMDDAGQDQMPALRARDGRRVTSFALTGYQGLAQPHHLTLDLGHVPDPRQLRLFLQGWIYPTDTNVNIAVSQDRSLPVIPPRIEAPDRRGGWRPVADVGLPAGKNKTVVVDLSGKLTPGDSRLRITTTMEIYWDRIFFTSGSQNVPLRVRKLAPVWSDLHYRGFSALVQTGRSNPDRYDYDRVDRAPRWRDQAGMFTRYGGVTPLLQAIDDRYVIMNSGDELLVQFGGDGPQPPPGWARDFVLVTDGWDKDANINTLASQTVEPLPFHGMKRYPYAPAERYPETPALRRWRRDYNTRRVTRRPFLEAIRAYPLR
jgi:Tfp pilus assembly protein PilF